MSFGISLNGKRVRGTNPVTLNSAILDDKRIAYSPKSYSVFDVNDAVSRAWDAVESPDTPPIFEDIFAWVEGDTLYLRGSSVSVVNNELAMTTTKARVESDTLYLVR